MDARGTLSAYPHLGIRATYFMTRWTTLLVNGRSSRAGHRAARLPLRLRPFTGRQDFGLQDRIDQVRPPDINEVGPLLVGGQPCSDALRHDQHDRSVDEVEPIGPPEQLIFAVARERVLFAAIQRRSVELGHVD